MANLSPDDLLPIELLLSQKKTREQGLIQLQSYMETFPHNPEGWKMMGAMFGAQNQHALTKVCYEEALRLNPQDTQTLWEISKACNETLREDEAEEFLTRLMGIDPSNANGPLGLSVCEERRGHYRESIHWAEKALELNPNLKHAKATMGFAYLHLREYEKGWRLYHEGLGHIANRNKHTYAGEPEWDGTPGQHIVVYSEQGLGDQIAGIEPLRDVPCTVTGLSVDHKLRNWFARCFPGVEHHGSDLSEAAQHPAHPLRIDASINLFGLHMFLRKSEEAYPKTPFLTPHPRKAAMWRTALDQLGPGPKIGVAWSGGVKLTHSNLRTHKLQSWAPLFGMDAHFISLEYKDRDTETAETARELGTEIHTWPDAIRSADYEDTAALISQLDVVVGPPTTVIHAAGAMGVPAWCLVHKLPNPHYAAHGDRMPYYGSVRLVRTDIEDLCQSLSTFLSGMTQQKIRHIA